jgi:4,5-DOPA dioxygenase extradiol
MHTRRELLGLLALGAVALGCRARKPTPAAGGKTVMTLEKETEPASSSARRMPVVFVGHGSPMNAVLDNRWSRGFAALGALVPEPKAILAVSAHWFVPGTYLTSNAKPKTIHDFGGFPQELYEIQYPAPGRPELAEHVRRVIGEQRAALSDEWGLDHGTWSVLLHMYPDARIPVLQLSLDQRLDMAAHHALARSLRELRDEGVLIVASGNIVHNLRDAMQRMHTGASDTPEWAQGFDADLAQALGQHDSRALVAAWPDSRYGRLAHPSPDHFIPLLYAQAASDERDAVTFPIEGFDLGSISMRAVLFG